jgi:hypothetical protein
LWWVFWDRVSLTICLGLASNLLISASWVAKILGMSLQCSASLTPFCNANIGLCISLDCLLSVLVPFTVLSFFPLMLRIKPWAFCMQGKHFTPKLHPSSWDLFLFILATSCKSVFGSVFLCIIQRSINDPKASCLATWVLNSNKGTVVLQVLTNFYWISVLGTIVFPG